THRAALPGAYNSYSRADADAAHDMAHEDHRMILWPLFFTSFLIDDFLDDNAFFGADEVVVSSASSKTAIGTAFQVAQRPAIRVVGLTSPGNLAFVDRLGVYDRIVTYDDVDALGDTRAAYVDVAGDAAVRAAVHAAYGDRLTHSMMVGATRWDEPPAAPSDLPGAAPTFFFFPPPLMEWQGAGGGGAARGAAPACRTQGAAPSSPRTAGPPPAAAPAPRRSRPRPASSSTAEPIPPSGMCSRCGPRAASRSASS